MVLEVIKTESHFFSENIYLNRTKDLATNEKTHAIVLADDDTHIIRSQSSQSKKLNLLTWSDLAFGFVNKRCAWVRDGIDYLLSYELVLSKS